MARPKYTTSTRQTLKHHLEHKWLRGGGHPKERNSKRKWARVIGHR